MIVVGMSHRSAPLAIREQFALRQADLLAHLGAMAQRTDAGELVLLSTCNRVEIMAAPRVQTPPARAELAARIAEEVIAIHPPARPHLYVHVGRAAVDHLFRVAASLDSLVMGEPQILGQLKAAFGRAKQRGTVGPWLNRAFERAFRVAKRVRTETSLGTGRVSVPTVVVDLARDIFGELAQRQALLVGTGEMAAMVARLLRRSGACLSVVGRTEARVRELALELGAQGRAWDELPKLLSDADVVISSTSATGQVIGLEQLKRTCQLRQGKPLFLVDLAVPRDIDPCADQLDGAFLYNIDDLSHVAERALNGRHREAERAERIVAEEVERYSRRACAERVTPTVIALRARFSSVLRAELERSLRGRLQHLPEEEKQTLERTLEAAVDKLLDWPTTHLRQWASDEEFGDWHTDLLVTALDDLFQLELYADHPEASSQKKGA
jgi:glutamyl-tRNA reductase